MSTPATLLLDIGNTRIKWARVTRAGIGRQRAVGLSGDGRPAFRVLLADLPAGTRILAVNVAGARVERALRAAARGAGLPAPRVLRTSRREGSLTNGYRDAWRLGADRWAAMLGARKLCGGQAICLVDAGTAMTVDFIDAAGSHRGGYIVPGPSLAVDSLLRGTRGIATRAGRAPGLPATRRGPGWPRATLPAIEQGSLESCVAMAVRCLAAARREMGPRTLLVITGGAAPAMRPLLPARTRHVPDLVLRGLHAWGAC
jgi:type III pantothenate kinase